FGITMDAMKSHLIFAMLIFVCSLNVYPQTGATTAAVTGTVKDGGGAPLTQAEITARELKTNLTRETVAAEDGSFLIAQLPPGDYEIKAAAPGTVSAAARLTLSIGTTAMINFVLPLEGSSGAAEAIVGSGSNEGSAERSTNIETQSISNLPIN